MKKGQFSNSFYKRNFFKSPFFHTRSLCCLCTLPKSGHFRNQLKSPPTIFAPPHPPRPLPKPAKSTHPPRRTRDSSLPSGTGLLENHPRPLRPVATLRGSWCEDDARVILAFARTARASVAGADVRLFSAPAMFPRALMMMRRSERAAGHVEIDGVGGGWLSRGGDVGDDGGTGSDGRWQGFPYFFWEMFVCCLVLFTIFVQEGRYCRGFSDIFGSYYKTTSNCGFKTKQ